MGIGRLLSYTDAGAPQLQGTVGSLAAVLKAALVDGYGSVAPLGWTLEYSADDYKQIAFRNNPVTGTGFYFRITDNLSDSRYADFSAYESMTGIDTYLNPILLTETKPFWVCKSYYSTSQSTAVPWHIVGDDRGFWISNNIYAQYPTSYTYKPVWGGLYIGDINPATVAYPYGFCLCSAGWYGSESYSKTPAPTYTLLQTGAVDSNWCVKLMRDISGIPGAVKARLGASTVSSDISGPYIGHSNIGPVNGVLYCTSPVFLVSTDSNTFPSTLYGTLPGYYDCAAKTGVIIDAVSSIVVDGDTTLLFLPGMPHNNTANSGLECIYAGPGWRDDI